MAKPPRSVGDHQVWAGEGRTLGIHMASGWGASGVRCAGLDYKGSTEDCPLRVTREQTDHAGTLGGTVWLQHAEVPGPEPAPG